MHVWATRKAVGWGTPPPVAGPPSAVRDSNLRRKRGTERRRGLIDHIEPILLVCHPIGRGGVTHDLLPKLRVHRREARDFVTLVVRTVGIDPTIVRDQWQTDFLLKCC